LPNYDEYTVGYTDRSALFEVLHSDKLGPRESILAQSILMDGRVTGTWKRTFKKKEIVIELAPFTLPTNEQNQAMIAATQQYGKFLGLPVVLTNSG
jgi:hypothetical protein